MGCNSKTCNTRKRSPTQPFISLNLLNRRDNDPRPWRTSAIAPAMSQPCLYFFGVKFRKSKKKIEGKIIVFFKFNEYQLMRTLPWQYFKLITCYHAFQFSRIKVCYWLERPSYLYLCCIKILFVKMKIAPLVFYFRSKNHSEFAFHSHFNMNIVTMYLDTNLNYGFNTFDINAVLNS